MEKLSRIYLRISIKAFSKKKSTPNVYKKVQRFFSKKYPVDRWYMLYILFINNMSITYFLQYKLNIHIKFNYDEVFQGTDITMASTTSQVNPVKQFSPSKR